MNSKVDNTVNNDPIELEDYLDGLTSIEMKNFWDHIGTKIADEAMERDGCIVYSDGTNIVKKYKDGTIEILKKCMTLEEFQSKGHNHFEI